MTGLLDALPPGTGEPHPHACSGSRTGGLSDASKVGIGFDRRTLLALRQELDQLQAADSPFAGRIAERTAHWVRPRLVAQIAFSEWTRDGMLRHSRHLGRRNDKIPTDVIRERGEP
ncbi:ATP dependent DNA ligase [Streptomyces sp. NPDC055140]